MDRLMNTSFGVGFNVAEVIVDRLLGQGKTIAGGLLHPAEVDQFHLPIAIVDQSPILERR